MAQHGNDFRKIYYYHLKKCGGTSLNSWLDRQVADDRVFNPAWLKSLAAAFLDVGPVPDGIEADEPSIGRAVFHWTDAVYSHMPLRKWVPEDTLCVTVLRNPIHRLISQVADWRRLSVQDYAALPDPMATMIRDASSMPLKSYLERYGRGTLVFDNYLVRALAASRLGFEVKAVSDASDLLGEALEALVHGFHVVGLTEEMETSLNAIAERFGRAPEDQPPRLNETRSASRFADEIGEAADVLAELTAVDRPLYERARHLFMDRHAARGASYNRAVFERGAALEAVQSLPGRWHGRGTIYSVRDPIVGSGFHSRDAAGTPACRVWSGPSSRSILYMPVPPGATIVLQLWVHGYASDRQRDMLTCAVDGVPAVHRFVAEDGYRDIVEVPARPSRGVLALEIDVGETVPAGTAGSPGSDARPRGFSFDRYGWRVVADTPAGF